jgi:hypothetical protein
MGWDRGRYYTRSRKVSGRVVREYVGTGPAAELAARLDARGREERARKARDIRRHKDDLDALDAQLKALCERVDLAARAALLAAGFHQHKRGEWRRKRDRDRPGP